MYDSSHNLDSSRDLSLVFDDYIIRLHLTDLVLRKSCDSRPGYIVVIINLSLYTRHQIMFMVTPPTWQHWKELVIRPGFRHGQGVPLHKGLLQL